MRRAIAYALPYDDMFKAALFSRGDSLVGATWADGNRRAVHFRSSSRCKLDLEKAKDYLTRPQAMPDGFSTTFSFNVGQSATAEPMAALLKESLAKIGIKVDIQKLPDAQMSTQITEKKLPFFTEGIVAWLPSTDYFYRNFYTGNQRWNYSSIDNAELTAVAQKARFEADTAKYASRRQGAERDPLRPDAPDPLWQAEPGRGDGLEPDGLHLSVPSPGRLPRPQSEVIIRAPCERILKRPSAALDFGGWGINLKGVHNYE